MKSINWQQWASLLRTLVPFAGGLLVMQGIMSATEFDSLINQMGKVVTDVTVLAGLLTPVVTAVWGMMGHTDRALTLNASALPGVKVVVDPKIAAPSVAALVADPQAPNVVAPQ